MSRLIKYPDLTLTLPPQYFGSVDYYAAMAAFGRVNIEVDARFDKRQKSVHRCEIADTHGLLRLTVPISKPSARIEGPLRWSDIAISDHGHWWQSVSESIASAYGRTPFYEYLIDRFSHFFSETTPTSFGTVSSLDEALNRLVVDFLGLEGEIVYGAKLDGSEVRLTDLSFAPPVSYYQVREAKHGFMPGLSILDLIFNLGPEAPLLLKRQFPALR